MRWSSGLRLARSLCRASSSGASNLRNGNSSDRILRLGRSMKQNGMHARFPETRFHGIGRSLFSLRGLSLAIGTGAVLLSTAITPVSLEDAIFEEGPQTFIPLDQVKSAEDLDIVLYAYQPCPFCNKVRAFLDYYNIPYRWVEVNPLTKAELKFSEYKKVPVAVINGKQINDSSEIINTIHPIVTPAAEQKATKYSFFSSTPSHDNTELVARETQWFEWVDSWLVHTLPPNIYRTRAEAMQTFDYLTAASNFSWYQRESARYVGAGAMYLVAKKLKKRHKIEDERQALYDAVDSWIGAVGDREFLGGDTPCKADLAVFGVLRSIENFDCYRDMMEHTNVAAWYSRMTNAVGDSTRVDAIGKK